MNRSTNRAFVRQRPGGRGDRVATWASGAVGYQRRADWEATEYASLPGEVVRRATASDPFDPRLPRTLVLAETTVTALGDGRYRVTARAVPAGDGTRPGYERLSFVVDDRGLVHALESVRVGPDRRTTRRFDLDPGGPVPPERPGWVAAAANATDA